MVLRFHKSNMALCFAVVTSMTYHSNAFNCFSLYLKPIAEALKDQYRNAVLSHFLPDRGPRSRRIQLSARDEPPKVEFVSDSRCLYSKTFNVE